MPTIVFLAVLSVVFGVGYFVYWDGQSLSQLLSFGVAGALAALIATALYLYMTKK